MLSSLFSYQIDARPGNSGADNDLKIAVSAPTQSADSNRCFWSKIKPALTKPKYLSTDHDPLFRWLANLRVIEVEEIKSVPYAPVSHPLVERLIGTIRREYLDRVFFWNAADLTITTPTAFTARSVARRPRNAPAHPQRRPPRFIVTLGSNIAAVCFRLQSPLN